MKRNINIFAQQSVGKAFAVGPEIPLKNIKNTFRLTHMKKVLFPLLAVVVMTTGCNQNKNASGNEAATPSDSTTTSSTTISEGMIAYVNIDTLVSKYNFYKDLQAEYESKAKKADDELNSKGRSLQNDVQDFQNKIDKGLVTRSEAATMQENLEKKQQDFLSHRDKVMSELAEEEQVMLNKIHYNITEYLKKFNEGYRFKVILSTSAGGPILNADPELDITNIVLEGLNKEYVPEKATADSDKSEEKK